MNNEAEVMQIITLLFETYRQGDDEMRIQIYAKRFSEFPANVVRTACRKVMDEQEYLPSIAHIVKAIKSLSGTAGARQLGFDEVYAEIEHELYRCAGTNRRPEFKSLAAKNLVGTFGWSNLITASTREASVIRAQMRQMYEAQCKRKDEQQTNRYLLAKNGVTSKDFPSYIGYHEVSNGGLVGIGNVMQAIAERQN